MTKGNNQQVWTGLQDREFSGFTESK